MLVKRMFDIFGSGLGLVILAPAFALMAIGIKLGSRGPVFFRQERVGRFGRVFRIHKFRTMVSDAERLGLQITVGRDARITPFGSVLRRYKLDELPQLLDVFLGRMSLVGPRPEVPVYVACYPPEVRAIVLSVRPGITDWASIRYKDENAVLERADDPQRAYVEEVLPIKLAHCVDYVHQRSFFGDIRIILATLKAVVR